MSGLFPNAWHVARREFLVRVRNRTFAVMTAVLVLAVVSIVLLPTIVRVFETDEPTRVGLYAGDGVPDEMHSTLEALLAQPEGAPLGPGEIAVVAVDDPQTTWEAERGELHGILEVERGANDELWFSYLTDAGPASQTLLLIRQAATSLAVDDRLARAGLAPEERAAMFAPAPFEIAGTDPEAPELQEFWGNYLMATALMVIVLMAVILYGNWAAVSVAEEKSSRVMEMLITAATPTQLMVGKVLGTGAAGLAQYAAFGIPAAVLLLLQGPIEAALFGAEAAEPMAAALTLEVLAVFGAFLVGGFLLYITLYAAAGATVSRQEDVAQVSGPAGFAAMGGYFIALFGMQSLDATWVVVLSLVPFFSPFLMPIRVLLGSVPPLELFAALAILLLSLALALFFAARIYSAGVLLYGQRRSVREVLGATRVAR